MQSPKKTNAKARSESELVNCHVSVNNSSRCKTKNKLKLTYKDHNPSKINNEYNTIHESNKDNVSITLEENNNRDNHSKHSENNINAETDEVIKIIKWNINENKYNNSDKTILLLLYECEINVDNLDKEKICKI